MTNEIRMNMIQTNVQSNQLIEEDELEHYGVLGMKWGVRRYQKYGEGGYTPKGMAIANKTYKKSIDKLDKLDQTAQKKKLKSAKLKYKAEKSVSSIFGNPDKYQKLKFKSAKQNMKATKAEVKSNRWADKMNKYLKGMPADLNDEQKRSLEKHNLNDLLKNAVMDKSETSDEIKKKRNKNKV